MASLPFVFTDEVKLALSANKPVVALESTIISHGMPYPENMHTALEIEQIVKDYGAVPATIALLDGVIHIGLTALHISQLAQKGHECIKCTRRNIAYVMTKGLYGSTTVAATMYLAYKAGIKFFVTGGIGGVHRGAEETWDVSADLTELGRTPVTVISAGIKSILDISMTLEYLETQGVPVIGYQTDFLPTFYSPISDYPVMCRLDSPQEIAEYVRNQELIGLENGMLVGVPLPPEDAANDVEQAIQTALQELKLNKISGAAVTPYVLKRVAELSKGDSLRASNTYLDIALIKNNAKVGTQIAVAYFNTKKLVVVGGSMYDVHGVCAVSQFPSGEAPGFVSYRPGGVGRNIAEAARKSHADVTLITVLGSDPQGIQLLEQLNALGLVTYIQNTSAVILKHDKRTSSFVGIVNTEGEMISAVADSEIQNALGVKDIIPYEHVLLSSACIILDCNFSTPVLQHVRDLAIQGNIPHPTADWHCEKLLNSGILNDTFILCPNYKELLLLSSTPSSSEFDLNLAKESAIKLRQQFPGIQHLVVKLGGKGVLYISSSHSEYIQVSPLASVSNSFGAGDTFLGALGAAYLETSDILSAIHKAVTAASKYLATNK